MRVCLLEYDYEPIMAFSQCGYPLPICRWYIFLHGSLRVKLSTLFRTTCTIPSASFVEYVASDHKNKIRSPIELS